MKPENAVSDPELETAGRGPVVPTKGKGAKSLNSQKGLDSAYAMNVEIPNKVLDNTCTMNKDLRRLIFSKPHQKMQRLTKLLENIN